MEVWTTRLGLALIIPAAMPLGTLVAPLPRTSVGIDLQCARWLASGPWPFRLGSRMRATSRPLPATWGGESFRLPQAQGQYGLC